jgi:hypothetical protein
MFLYRRLTELNEESFVPHSQQVMEREVYVREEGRNILYHDSCGHAWYLVQLLAKNPPVCVSLIW